MTAFQSLSHFEQSLALGYRLTPFRFTSLDSDRYVLSNQAGEFLICRRVDLQMFVEHDLSTSDPLYADLKSKHFLVDEASDVGLDLLALKVRTKLNRLPEFTSLHIFVVSLRCEHSCPYCQVSRQSDDRKAFDMSIETAIRSLDLVFQSPARAIKIEFQGGESLLNFDLIKTIVEDSEHRNQTEGRNLQFVIATNLAPLSEEILEYCAGHNIYLSTSLDGPADLHNKNRPRPGGNSHELATTGIDRVRGALGRDRISALMTTTEASLDRARDIVDEYLRCGLNSVFLRPLSPYGFAIKTKSFDTYDVNRWLDFYREGLDYILEINRSGTFFVEQYSAMILTKMLTPFEPGYVDLTSPSGIGISAVVYNYDGDVYASDEARMLSEMGDTTFRVTPPPAKPGASGM